MVGSHPLTCPLVWNTTAVSVISTRSKVMLIFISERLNEIVTEEEVEAVARWFLNPHSQECDEVVLVPVAAIPEDVATSSAVLIVRYSELSERDDYALCNIYSRGDNPHKDTWYSCDQSHIFILQGLSPELKNEHEIIEEAVENSHDLS